MNWSFLIWIAIVIFVYIFGLFEGRTQGKKMRKEEELRERKENPPAPVMPLTNTVTVDDPGLMRIKNENGFLTLDLDGTRVDTSALSGDQRKRLIEMLTLIRPWLEGKPAPAPMTAPPPQPKPVAPSSTYTPPKTLSQVTGQKPVAKKPTNQPTTNPPTAPKPSNSVVAKEDRPVAPATSMVGQIDSILQERLAGTPLEERGIFLAQSPDGGVMVYVGLTKYMAIDDVPDTDIKAAIRAAITEWENKYTPGLK